MAFTKTSIAFSPPRRIESIKPPKIGDEREGKVWDGEDWVDKAEWESRQTRKE
jgi:hypothetical protein